MDYASTYAGNLEMPVKSKLDDGGKSQIEMTTYETTNKWGDRSWTRIEMGQLEQEDVPPSVDIEIPFSELHCHQ